MKISDGRIFGPAATSVLVKWAEDGRIDASAMLSHDKIDWILSYLIPELDLKWLVETEPGKVFGPFNRKVVAKMVADRDIQPSARLYRLHELPIDEDTPPQIVEKVVEKEVRVEVPVEKIVEKVVEKEVRVEVPVEKIVEKVVEILPPERDESHSVQVIEPKPPQMRSPGAIFGNLGHDSLKALEEAARLELMKSGCFNPRSGLFGRKKK